jgi:hypothetical protein
MKIVELYSCKEFTRLIISDKRGNCYISFDYSFVLSPSPTMTICNDQSTERYCFE